VTAALLTLAFTEDDRDIEPDQRAHIADPMPAGADDFNDLPGTGDGGRNLAHPVVVGTRVSVNVGQQFGFFFEGHGRERVVVDIERLVGADGIPRQGPGATGAHRLHGVAGAFDGGFG